MPAVWREGHDFTCHFEVALKPCVMDSISVAGPLVGHVTMNLTNLLKISI